MHIKNPQSALLSNHEVYLHIQSESTHYLAKENARNKALNNTREILQDGLRYFAGDPSTTGDTWANPTAEISTTHHSRPMTLYKGPHSLLRALAPRYKLNKAEYLQLYNVRPSSRITLELIIEEATTRFTEEELDDILDTVLRVFEEEEKDIPAGVEELEMERLPEEQLGDSRRKKKGKARKKA